jgi:hypothetical protein
MVTTIRRSALLLSAASLFAFPALAHALTIAPGQTQTLNTVDPPPIVSGQQLVDHVVDSADLVVPIPGPSGPTNFKQLTVTLVTNVYRNSGGTLTFAYNISSDTFPQPGTGPALQASLPSLNITNLASFSVDARAENIPNAAPSGAVNPAELQLIRSPDGNDLQYLFATRTTGLIFRDNTLFPPQQRLTTPAVVFIQTDATDFTLDQAKVEVHSFDGRNPGGFTTAFLSLDSFVPTIKSGTPPPVPEPLTLLTLPLALAALALRRQIR